MWFHSGTLPQPGVEGHGQGANWGANLVRDFGKNCDRNHIPFRCGLGFVGERRTRPGLLISSTLQR
jgi:hypothetical protein